MSSTTKATAGYLFILWQNKVATAFIDLKVINQPLKNGLSSHVRYYYCHCQTICTKYWLRQCDRGGSSCERFQCYLVSMFQWSQTVFRTLLILYNLLNYIQPYVTAIKLGFLRVLSSLDLLKLGKGGICYIDKNQIHLEK